MRLSPSTDTIRRERRRGRARLWLVLILLAGLAIAGLGAFRVGPAPVISIRPSQPAIGRATTAEVEVTEPSRGLSQVTVELVQGGVAIPLAEESFRSLAGWKLWGDRTERKVWKLDIGKDARPALAEGEAVLRVAATPAPGWLRHGKPVVAEVQLAVRLTAPSLGVESSQHYVAQGGCEAVVYRVGPTSVRDGVEVGDWFFPGYPLPGGGEGEKFALFAVPYDQGDASRVKLVTTDDVGNSRSTEFVDRFFPEPPRQDTIRLDDAFMTRAVSEIRENTPDLPDRGSLLANYIEINRELRQRNAAELRTLATKTKPEFLWRAPFLALPGGQVMSHFADHRTYLYDGREVDQEDHLGFDLASVTHADVPASNSGVVVMAKYFGIYGNAVVIDHGYGLMSLYAHLSQIAVKEGETVRRAQIIGRSGQTGLAGGDHLHFSFLLQGLPVRPVEWWDPHWIQDRIQRKLGRALPFGRAASETVSAGAGDDVAPGA
jgi:murein DD-endopeptidase MepM/ murein hydrolase activator NlpD